MSYGLRVLTTNFDFGKFGFKSVWIFRTYLLFPLVSAMAWSLNRFNHSLSCWSCSCGCRAYRFVKYISLITFVVHMEPVRGVPVTQTVLNLPIFYLHRKILAESSFKANRMWHLCCRYCLLQYRYRMI